MVELDGPAGRDLVVVLVTLTPPSCFRTEG